MYNPRTIEEIQSLYLSTVVETGSGISLDTTQGSVIYTLSRAAAVIAYDSDLALSDISNSASLLTAAGNALDNIGLSFSIPRLSAEFAEGYVLALSTTTNTTIPSATVLTNLDTGLQFVTTNTTPVLVYNNLEIPIKVKALQDGSDSNLISGTQLFSDSFSTVKFRVGYNRIGDYVADLTGGRDEETDDSYRYRIAQTVLTSGTSSSSQVVSALLTYPLVERAFVRTTVPGILEIWVDAGQTYTEFQRQEITTFIKPYLAAGIVPTVIQTERILVDISLEIEPLRSINNSFDYLSQQLSSIISNQISTLSVGETLILKSLQDTISPLVRRVKIQTPTKDVVPKLNQIIIPGNIKVSFPLEI